MQLDPLNPFHYILQGERYRYDGRYDLTLEALHKAYQMDPGNPSVLSGYAFALAYSEKGEEAFFIIKQMEKTSRDNAFARTALKLKYALRGDNEKVSQEMTQDLQKTCQRDAAFSYAVATIMALLDAKKEALDWFENAVNRRFINYPLLAEKDPWLAGIRGEERFKKLMERVKYEWEHFEV